MVSDVNFNDVNVHIPHTLLPIVFSTLYTFVCQEISIQHIEICVKPYKQFYLNRIHTYVSICHSLVNDGYFPDNFHRNYTLIFFNQSDKWR